MLHSEGFSYSYSRAAERGAGHEGQCPAGDGEGLCSTWSQSNREVLVATDSGITLDNQRQMDNKIKKVFLQIHHFQLANGTGMLWEEGD